MTLRSLFDTESPSPERLAAIEKALAVDEKSHTPWYIQALIGVGAWLASIFFLVFASLMLESALFGPQRWTLGIAGLMVLGITVAIRRVVSGLFASQCCLAFSFAAQAMMLFGFVPDADTLGIATLLFSTMTLVLYFGYPDFLHRTLTCLAASQLIYWYICTSRAPVDGSVNLLFPGSLFLMLDVHYLVHVMGILWCFLPVDRHEARRPLGYALLASLVVITAEPFVRGWFFDAGWSHLPSGAKAFYPWYLYFEPIFVAGALFLVGVWAAGGKPVLLPYRQAWTAFAALLGVLVFFHLNSVMVSLLIVLLGFSLQNRLVLVLGCILFPVFLFNYYFALQLDLMEKSGVLILSGGLFLLLRLGLARLIAKEPA